MRVIKQHEDGIVRRVRPLDDAGDEVEPVGRFLSHLTDSNYSPNTVSAYAYDLRHLAQFLDQHALGWNDFRPSTALEFLAHLRRMPSRRAGAASGADGRHRAGPAAVGGHGAAGARRDLELL